MSTISRRQVLKVAAAAGLAGWVAPEIETTVAEAQTPQPHACCACYFGDPPGKPGAFVAVAVDHYTKEGCVMACEKAAPKGTHGVVLHFTSSPKIPFAGVGSGHSQPGCHIEGHWLNRVIVPPGPPDGPGYHSHCPPPSQLQPLGVKCDRGYWST
jgi:hypothetical protein